MRRRSKPQTLDEKLGAERPGSTGVRFAITSNATPPRDPDDDDEDEEEDNDEKNGTDEPAVVREPDEY